MGSGRTVEAGAVRGWDGSGEVKKLWGSSPCSGPSSLRYCRQDPQHSGVWHPGYTASHPPLPESLAHTGASSLPPSPPGCSKPPRKPSFKPTVSCLQQPHLAPPPLYPRDIKISETIGHLFPRWERCLGIGGEGGGEGRWRWRRTMPRGRRNWDSWNFCLLSQHPRASRAITELSCTQDFGLGDLRHVYLGDGSPGTGAAEAQSPTPYYGIHNT